MTYVSSADNENGAGTAERERGYADSSVVTVTDGDVNTDTATVTVDVTAEYDPPSIEDIADQFVDRGMSLMICTCDATGLGQARRDCPDPRSGRRVKSAIL